MMKGAAYDSLLRLAKTNNTVRVLISEKEIFRLPAKKTDESFRKSSLYVMIKPQQQEKTMFIRRMCSHE